MLNHQKLTTIMSAAWSLTVGGVSGPEGPVEEPSCLDAPSMDDETGTEVGDTVDSSAVSNTAESA